jgi:hypothetical protein
MEWVHSIPWTVNVWQIFQIIRGLSGAHVARHEALHWNLSPVQTTSHLPNNFLSFLSKIYKAVSWFRQSVAGPGSRPGQCIWDLWWTDLTGTGFSLSSFISSLTKLFHRGSILIYIMNNRPVGARSSETVSPHRHEQYYLHICCLGHPTVLFPMRYSCKHFVYSSCSPRALYRLHANSTVWRVS